MSLHIERLEPADAPGNAALSRSVGWKDVESEWRVLHAAAEVRGIRQGGRILAQGALGDYGTAATLAKMVVATELQRQGWGARLLDGFLQQADTRKLPVGLVATDLGRPLYASRGFEHSGDVVILYGEPTRGIADAGSVVQLRDAEPAVSIDAAFSGCDRSRMLRARFVESQAAVQLTTERGFGLLHPQGDHAIIGPILAETEQGARELLAALFARVSGPVRVDVPAQYQSLRSWIWGQGLREMSVRVEMAYGARRVPWQSAQRFALATQAWG